jgi:MerR family transcriptional regulator, light-induced transcriptional regulator
VPKELVSPKQVAKAIGVSESSLKRWCDRGLIPTTRTAGGHRKMPVSGVLEFLRSTGHSLVKPELLGLPAATGRGERTLTKANARFFDAIVAGDEAVCCQIALDLMLAKIPISSICDRVIAGAFRQIGELWDHGELAVFQERRACEICLRVIHELRSTLPVPQKGAPWAIGGTLSGDHYDLPTALVELTLLSLGWNAASFGTSLPSETVQEAILKTKPKLFWLSVSFIDDEDGFLEAVPEIRNATETTGAAFAVGGRALHSALRRQIAYSAFCDTLQHLESFAATLHSK